MQADRNFDGSGFRNIRCLTKMGVEFHEEKGKHYNAMVQKEMKSVVVS